MFPQRKSGTVPGASQQQASPGKIKARARQVQRPNGPRSGAVLYGGGLGARTTQEYGKKRPFGGKRPKKATAEGLY